MAKAKPKPSFQFKALSIVCTDRWRSERFYKDVLGAVDLPGDITCRWYRLGTLTITLVPNADRGNPANFGQDALNMIFLEVDDLEAAQKHFARHKVEIMQPSDGQMMIIVDPDGLPIEVWQREVNTKESYA